MLTGSEESTGSGWSQGDGLLGHVFLRLFFGFVCLSFFFGYIIHHFFYFAGVYSETFDIAV